MARRTYSPEAKAQAIARARQPAVSSSERPLSPRQERFVDEYLVDLNGAQAYMRAGYAVANADVAGANAARLLADARVSALVAERKAALAAHAQISREQLIDELKAIAFGDPRDIVSWGPDGVRLQASSGLTREQAITVSEVSETPGRYGTSRRIKRESRLEALREIGRLLGYYPKEPLVDNRTVNVFSADDAIRALLEARRQLAEPKEG